MLDLTASTPDQLAVVEGELHDWFFDPEEVRHVAHLQQVVIPFRRWDYSQARELPVPPSRSRLWRRKRSAGRTKQWEAPFYRWYLYIDHVRSLAIEDEAEIGTADFNTVTFDPREGTLIIECSFPVTLRLDVDDLLVRIEETHELLGMAQYMTSGDPLFATAYSGEIFPPSSGSEPETSRSA